MGALTRGSAKQTGSAQLMDPSQLQYLQQALQGLGPQAQGAFSQFLQPYDEKQFQGLFQQAFIDPAMMAYEQQALPAIQQRFIDAGAGSSSALNQALGQSAADLSTMLGTQMGQFYQGQQQNQLGALGILGGMLGQRTQEPIVTQRQSPLSQIFGGIGAMQPWRWGGR